MFKVSIFDFNCSLNIFVFNREDIVKKFEFNVFINNLRFAGSLWSTNLKCCFFSSMENSIFWSNSFWAFLTTSYNSDLTGVTNSAAAVGVGALKSETKSIKVVSVSCPIAEIIGILLSNTAFLKTQLIRKT